MSNPVPLIPAKDSPWTQLLAGRAAGAGVPAGAGAAAAAEGAVDEATLIQIESAVHEVNAALALREVGLRFEIDKDTDKLIVKVVDRASGDVIRQIPNEEVVRFAKFMREGNGLLVDQAA
jgi:flagellar protein FlaG